MGELTKGTIQIHRLVVDVATLAPAKPVEIFPSGTPIYGVVVRSLTSKQLPPLVLRFTATEFISLVALGERVIFPDGITLGLSLGLAYARPGFLQAGLNPVFGTGAAPGSFVEVLVASAPDAIFDMLKIDPWESAPRFMFGKFATAVSPNLPFVRLTNPTSYASGTALFGVLRKVRMVSSIDGVFDVRRQLNSPTTIPFALPKMVLPTIDALAGLFAIDGAASAAAVGEGQTSVFLGCKANQDVAWEPDIELFPDKTNSGAFAAVVVNGPVGSSIWVSYDWNEIPVL